MTFHYSASEDLGPRLRRGLTAGSFFDALDAALAPRFAALTVLAPGDRLWVLDVADRALRWGLGPLHPPPRAVLHWRPSYGEWARIHVDLAGCSEP